MDEMEFLANGYFQALYGLKFSSMLQAIQNVNPELFDEYERIFKDAEQNAVELKDLKEALEAFKRRQN